MGLIQSFNIMRKRREKRKAIKKMEKQLLWRSQGNDRYHERMRDHLNAIGQRPEGLPAEIWIGGYLTGKHFIAFKSLSDNRIYTSEYKRIAETVGKCKLYNTGEILEIQKEYLFEETRGIPIKSGYIDAEELLATMENMTGYYVKEIIDVNGVAVLKAEYEPLNIWVGSKQLKGYTRFDKQCIFLHDLNEFACAIGTYKPQSGKVRRYYMLADIYDRKFRFEGITLVSSPLPYYNVLDAEYIAEKAAVDEDEGGRYVVTNRWEKAGENNVTLAQQAGIKAKETVAPIKLPDDFGQMLNEHPPEDRHNVTGVVYMDGVKLESSFDNGVVRVLADKKTNKYFGAHVDARAAAAANGDKDVTGYWYDENANEQIVVINREMKNAPVKLVRIGNQISVRANIVFEGKAANKKFSDTGSTYDEIIAKGIKMCWEGRYINTPAAKFGARHVDVKIELIQNEREPFILWNVGEKGNKATSPFEKLRYAKSAKDNRVDFYVATSDSVLNFSQLAQTASHMFGHILGLPDTVTQPGTSGVQAYGSLMSDTAAYANSADIAAVLSAFVHWHQN